MIRSHKIGWLVLVLAVLFVLWRLPRLHGQGFGSFSHDQPFLAASPATPCTFEGLPFAALVRARWVASDLANGSITLWTGRTGGLNFWQDTAGLRPVKNSMGVWFDTGVDRTWMWMSNVNYNADTEAMALVLDHPRARPIAGQYLGKIMATEAGDPTLGFEQSTLYPTNGILNWNATSPTRVLDWSGSFLSTNAISEVLWFHYNGHDVPYTNGVAAVEDADQNLTGTLNFNQLGAHRAWSYPYLGGIQEIVIFSKTNWSAADIAAWHCYCTTTYGFSP